MGLIYFLAYLFLEIIFSYEFAKVFTPFGLFLEVLLTAIIGISVIRSLNFSLAESMQRVLRREMSEEEFLSIGLFRLIGGILLFIPGVFSDILGVLLMFEGVARFFAKKLFPSHKYYHHTHYGDDEIIDVEIIEVKKIEKN
ncbi:MAG: FxsA family protein [Nautiliaceae bacterium]